MYQTNLKQIYMFKKKKKGILPVDKVYSPWGYLGYSPWDRKELDMTEQLYTHTHTHTHTHTAVRHDSWRH